MEKLEISDVLNLVDLQQNIFQRNDKNTSQIISPLAVRNQTVFLNFELGQREEFYPILKDTYITTAKLGSNAKLVNTDELQIGIDL